jgi:hypothetical protein
MVTEAEREMLKSTAEKLAASGCYTIVIKGHPRDFPGNPFTMDNPFGQVIAIGYGNAFDAKEEVEVLLSEIGDLVGR